MGTAIHDVSNYLYGIKSKKPKIVAGLPVDGVEKLMFRLLENPLHHHILVFAPTSASDGYDKDTAGYQGTRDNKPFELKRLESLLQTFAEDINYSVVIADRGNEADDHIYTLAKKCAAQRETTVVYSDDIDMAACVVNSFVTVCAVNQPKPTITLENYETCAARSMIAHNMIAFYVALHGKQSDNIPPMPDAQTLMLKLYKVVYDYRQNSNLLYKSIANHASEYTNFVRIVKECDTISDSEREELLRRAEFVCCHALPMDIPDVVRPRASKVYAMLRAIGSNMHPKDGVMDYELANRIIQWLGEEVQVSSASDGVLDMSAYTLDLSSAFEDGKG